jgi:hypothetical protein
MYLQTEDEQQWMLIIRVIGSASLHVSISLLNQIDFRVIKMSIMQVFSFLVGLDAHPSFIPRIY